MDIVELNKLNPKRHPWELARLHILTNLLKDSVHPTKKYYVVDIGCGDCFFAQAILKRWDNIEVIAVDTAYTIDEVQLKEKEVDHPGFKLFNNLGAAKSHLNNQVADLVLLLDVIEHIEKDNAFLKELNSASFIKTGTRMLVTVPAYQILFSAHDAYLKHFRRYSLKQLTDRVSKAGFTPVQSGYFFLVLLPIRILEKVREKLSGAPPPTGIGEWKGSQGATTFIKKALIFDFWIGRTLKKLGFSLPGLSAFTVCKK